ncbi:hypothetical protein [Deinococcus hopiensis]|uniref:Uncharacterized protein n=1 Tax=Deinococcus hopiensis KR-140 TaxID=695939 RepID=A0A1W1VLP5_9DEIO|nr:hypothetical protein [Deinococcus hopiensis]SMB94140.1 hypothetical protein SAMN00790413_02261 [Deinococcus hopiensis KR-140]
MSRFTVQMFALPITAILILSGCGATSPAPTFQGPQGGTVLDAQTPEEVPLQALSGVKLSDADARARVKAAGITISSSGNCSDRYNSSCTSLEQVNSGTTDGILTLKRASGCAINITGGTETGHSSGTYSHWNGYKLDISKYTCIGDYIRNSFTRISDRGDGAPRYQSAAGNIYADEYWANHWDILYY